MIETLDLSLGEKRRRGQHRSDCSGTLQTGGYAQFTVEGRHVRVHRWSYEHFIGPTPPDFTIDHLCRVRRCVNPTHLEPVTRGENVRRGWRFDSA